MKFNDSKCQEKQSKQRKTTKANKKGGGGIIKLTRQSLSE